MGTCNTTLEDSHIVEDPLWHDFTFHHFGLLLCAIFGLISVVVSLWLIAMHALHYLRPNEQKHIIRILFMIPVYSIVSFLSYMFYRKAVYFEVLRDCYEAFAISSFFSLLCQTTQLAMQISSWRNVSDLILFGTYALSLLKPHSDPSACGGVGAKRGPTVVPSPAHP